MIMQKKKKILKIGHRGAAGLEPENTLRSFKRAIALGVDMIELDVHLSKDKQLVVMHDATINRTTNRKGSIKAMNLSRLKTFNAGKGEKIPMLEEVLELAGRRVKVDVELKAKGCARAAAKLIKGYIQKKRWNRKLFHVSSFNHRELKLFHRLMPKIETGALIEKYRFKNLEDFFRYVKGLGASSINIPYDHTTEEIVEEAHRHRLKVLVWTVDRRKDIAKMKNICVDGIISDHPERL